MRRKPRSGQVCQAANDNGGGQVVVSGNKAAVERAVEIAKTKGAKRAMLLPVSAPFHCALMQPAADAMAEALANTEVKKPVVPVVANVLAQPIDDPQEIVKRLVEQVTGTVRWRECVETMNKSGVTQFYEIGSGRVLTGPVEAYCRRRDRFRRSEHRKTWRRSKPRVAHDPEKWEPVFG